MMKMTRLWLMMGAPGSGKSTWAKANMPDGAMYISRDNIRYDLLRDGEEYFSREGEVYETFVNQIAAASKITKDVIADQTSLDRRARTKLLNALNNRRAYFDEVNVIWINRPLSQILEFNAKRTGRERVPDNAVINMFNRIEKPTASERINNLYIYNGETMRHEKIR